MTCPYCGKRVKDMPDHLQKKPLCHEKHVEKLKSDLAFVYQVHVKNNS